MKCKIQKPEKSKHRYSFSLDKNFNFVFIWNPERSGKYRINVETYVGLVECF